MQVYINRAGQQFGPYSMEQVTQGLAEGSLVATDLAWHEGADEWVPLSQLKASPAFAATPLPDTKPAPKKTKPPAPSKTPPWLIRAGIGLLLLHPQLLNLFFKVTQLDDHLFFAQPLSTHFIALGLLLGDLRRHFGQA